MVDATLEATGKKSFRHYEFLIFSIAAFVGKSALLIRLPYRPAAENAFYTTMLLVMFYLYFRFRYKLTPPTIIVFCLGAAVGVDVMGNYLQLYGTQFGPVQYDEFSHFLGSAFALVPAMWLVRATTKRFGHNLPLDFIAFISVAITFSFCAYYEILELWDELFWGDFERLHGSHDSANDLQYDLAGIIAAALVSSLVYKLADRRRQNE
ncbi:MAG: hypothetical protein L0229_17370 [Blastocatellia bacterium]|nr:hypothetical protein [Blastocatellia bacterium]